MGAKRLVDGPGGHTPVRHATDNLNPSGNKNHRSQEGGKRAVCLKSEGRGAIGMESGCQSRNREMGVGRRGEGSASQQCRLLQRGCTLFPSTLSKDGCGSELRLLRQGQLVCFLFFSPLSRAADTAWLGIPFLISDSQ